MCRWLAYNGSPIYLESLIFRPVNSLISQSRHALHSVSVTNADGFGVAWYGEHPEPGLFRDILPAWNDENLRSISRQIRSRLFFAHVRASTGSSVSRANCHPFVHGNWMFMHNGNIGGFDRLRRGLGMLVAPELYTRIAGTTDSETLFYLLLSNGLLDDPPRAFETAIGQVRTAMEEAGIDDPFTFTGAVSDGETLYAVRYASHGDPPSLFYGCGVSPSGAPDGDCGCPDDSILVLSEPLDHNREQWVEVPPDHLLVTAGGAVSVAPLFARARSS